MSTEHELIRAMFDHKQAQDLANLRKANEELKPLIDNSNRVLKGMVDVNTLTPKSQQAQ